MSRNRFTIIHSNTDYSKPLSDFIRKDSQLIVTSGEFIYVGLYKPFNNVYFNLTTPNPTETTLTIEQNTKTGWQSVMESRDGTDGMSRSGFISWTEEDDNRETIETTVDGKTMFFYRISSDENIDMLVRAIGVIFSDDDDIYLESPILDSERYRKRVVGSDTDYIRVHIQVREYLIQEIRNKGIKKYNSENDDVRLKFFRQITEFDFFDLDEVKLACTKLAMSNIYYKLSDDPEDNWKFEGDRYRQEYYRALDVAFISIDFNDDGKLDSSENMKPIKAVRISR